MTDHGQLPSPAAFKACGVDAEMLPPSDDETLRLGRKLTSGKECYPCILTTGDLAKLVKRDDFDPEKNRLFSCPRPTDRAGSVSTIAFQRLVLDELGYPNVPDLFTGSDR